MSDQRHPYADHPAAAVLADHEAYVYAGRSPATPAHCDCDWTGPSCDHPAHLTEVLHRAGLLADGPPPETPHRTSPRREGQEGDCDVNDAPKTTTLTDPPEGDEIELRQRILEALDPILDEEEANDAAIAAAAAVVRPPGLQDDIVDHELLAALDEITRLRRERDDARSAGLVYKRDRDRWKGVAAIHACAAPGRDGWPCEHYRDLFNSQPDDLASPETGVSQPNPLD